MNTDSLVKNVFSKIGSPKWFFVGLLAYFSLIHLLFSATLRVPEQLLWVDYSGGWLNPIWSQLNHSVAYVFAVILYVCAVYSMYLFVRELTGNQTTALVVSLITGLSPLSLSLILIQDNLPFLFGTFLVFNFYLLYVKHSTARCISISLLIVTVPEMLPLCSLALLLKRWPALQYVSVKDKLKCLLIVALSCGHIAVLKLFIQRDTLYPFWLLFDSTSLVEFAKLHLCEMLYVLIRFFSTQSKIFVEASTNIVFVNVSASIAVFCLLSLIVSPLRLRKVSFFIQWFVLSYVFQLGLPPSWFVNDRLLIFPLFGIVLVAASCFSAIKAFLAKHLNFRLFELVEVNSVLLFLVVLFSAMLTLGELRVWSSSKDLFQFLASESENAADAHHAIGQMFMNEGMNLQAIEALRKSLLANPRKYRHLSNTIGQLYFSQKDFNSAVQWFLVSKRNSDTDGVADYWLGKSYYELGAYIDSKTSFLASLPRIDNKGDAYFELFKLSLIEDNLNQAEHYLRHSLTLNGQNLENTLWSAVLYIRQEKFKEGLYIFEKFQNDVNRNPVFLDWQMVGYGSIGSFGNAEKILNYLVATQKSTEEYKNHYRQAKRHYERNAGRISEKVPVQN